MITKMAFKTSILTSAQKQEDNIPGFDWFSETRKQCPSEKNMADIQSRKKWKPKVIFKRLSKKKREKFGAFS